jgi:hypothetical protein
MPSSGVSNYYSSMRAMSARKFKVDCVRRRNGRPYTCMEMWPEMKNAWCDDCRNEMQKFVKKLSK